ncbi:MAG: Lrp/AsnC family transcriptional regulator [Eubacterium sp.]|nr:Lrp/AsnC family transcriptional regulator [Eubacterium sp.]
MKERLLQLLAKNSKLETKDLAVMLDTTEENIQKTLAEMESDGIICGYPTLINWDNTDFEHVTALIEVKVSPERGRGFDKVAERIYQYEEVESLYLMSGGFDFTVIIDGKSMKEVALFVATKLSPLESVVSTSTHFVLKKYKDYGLSLVEGESEDERQLITP